jgi:hypothetical protein
MTLNMGRWSHDTLKSHTPRAQRDSSHSALPRPVAAGSKPSAAFVTITACRLSDRWEPTGAVKSDLSPSPHPETPEPASNMT